MYPRRFYDYSTFLKKKFGEKVYKISVDAGFTCPNINGKRGTGGCIYCNNRSFTPACPDLSVSQQIQNGIELRQSRFKARKFLVYFQPHTNTYAPVERLREVYSEALAHPNVVGIAIGTRPDEVDVEKMDMLEEMARRTFVSIEYGVQTKNERTLLWINRGHTYQSFIHAMELTRGRGIHTCAHIMLGFPQEAREEMIEMAEEMNGVGVDGVKLHNLIITRDTRLAQMYAENPFPLLRYEEYIELVCDFLERLLPAIVVERLFATTMPEYLIAPSWNKSPDQLANDVTRRLKERDTCQGYLVKEALKIFETL